MEVCRHMLSQRKPEDSKPEEATVFPLRCRNKAKSYKWQLIHGISRKLLIQATNSISLRTTFFLVLGTRIRQEGAYPANENPSFLGAKW